LIVKVEDEELVSKYHVMKAYKGSGGRATVILNLGNRWRRVGSFTLRSPFFRESPPGTQRTHALFAYGEKKNLFPY
jgi:hypothetical protein